jgi:chromosome segregation ATPase
MNDKEARELTENIESLPDYEKIWMTLGNLTSSIEGLAELQQSQAETIQRILNNFGRFDADLRAHRQRVANLEQDRKGMMARIKDLEDDLHEEWRE